MEMSIFIQIDIIDGRSMCKHSDTNTSRNKVIKRNRQPNFLPRFVGRKLAYFLFANRIFSITVSSSSYSVGWWVLFLNSNTLMKAIASVRIQFAHYTSLIVLNVNECIGMFLTVLFLFKPVWSNARSCYFVLGQCVTSKFPCFSFFLAIIIKQYWPIFPCASWFCIQIISHTILLSG